MNILHLKYAVEIAKTGSINKAAENLYMAQPNLSRAIKELENSLGIEIFERTSKGMIPTPDGEKFLQYATKILVQVDEVERVFHNRQEDKQCFSISVPRASYISHAFSRFSKNLDQDRKAEVFYEETNSQRVIDNIIHGDYRLGIVRYPVNHDRYFKELFEEKELSYELLTEFSYLLLLSKSHPLANYEEVHYEDLASYIEVAHADPYVPSLSFAEAGKTEHPNNTGRHIFVFERASQFELLAVNPETFMWVSPVPQDLLNRYELVQKKCPENSKVYRDILIYHKEYHLSALDKMFLTELCRSRRQIVD